MTGDVDIVALVADLVRLRDAATAGPWEYDEDHWQLIGSQLTDDDESEFLLVSSHTGALDAALIVAAVNAIGDIAAGVAALAADCRAYAKVNAADEAERDILTAQVAEARRDLGHTQELVHDAGLWNGLVEEKLEALEAERDARLDAAEKVCRSLDHVLDGRHWPDVWAALVAWRELAP